MHTSGNLPYMHFNTALALRCTDIHISGIKHGFSSPCLSSFLLQRWIKSSRCHYRFVGKHCIGEGSHVTTRNDLFSSFQALTFSLSPELHLLLDLFFNHPPLPSFCGLLHKSRRKENFQTKNGLGRTRANFSTHSGKFIPFWSTFVLSILSLRFC